MKRSEIEGGPRHYGDAWPAKRDLPRLSAALYHCPRRHFLRIFRSSAVAFFPRPQQLVVFRGPLNGALSRGDLSAARPSRGELATDRLLLNAAIVTYLRRGVAWAGRAWAGRLLSARGWFLLKSPARVQRSFFFLF